MLTCLPFAIIIMNENGCVMEIWHEMVLEDFDARRHNTIREWCRDCVGSEFDDWMHIWTPGGSGMCRGPGHYTWRFRRQEDAVMFGMVWG